MFWFKNGQQKFWPMQKEHTTKFTLKFSAIDLKTEL